MYPIVRRSLVLSAVVGCLFVTPADALPPDPTGEHDCEPWAELTVDTQKTGGVGFPGQTIELTGRANIARLSSGCRSSNHTGPVGVWSLTKPAGSTSTIVPNGRLATFVPDRVGTYTARYAVCKGGCPDSATTLAETSDDIAVTVSDRYVVEAARLPRVTQASPTETQSYSGVANKCPGTNSAGLDWAPQWLTTTTWAQGATPAYRLLEGAIIYSRVSRKDSPGNHESQDTNLYMIPDAGFGTLRQPKTRTVEVEWETAHYPEPFRGTVGDRASVLGYHMVECAHGFYTEIHPPLATAIHRARPVRLPQTVGGTLVGDNVVVPGIVTDVFVSRNGGSALDGGGSSLSRPIKDPVPDPNRPGQTLQRWRYVKGPSPTAGVRFTFKMHLPPSPQAIVKDGMGLTPRGAAQLFVDVAAHPDGPSNGASIGSLPFTRRDSLEGLDPYVEFSFDLSRVGPSQRAALRIRAAWVFPDASNNNYGLRAYRVKIRELRVRNDADPFPKGDGDWRFWINVNSVDRPWTRLISCDGCVEEKTYTGVTGSPWRSGALTANGTLPTDMLLFAGDPLYVHASGYESDLMVGDDTGTVQDVLRHPETLPTRDAIGQCENQVSGGTLASIPDSGCAGYTLKYQIVPGTSMPRSNISSQLSALAAKFVLSARPSRTLVAPQVFDLALQRIEHDSDAPPPGAVVKLSPDAFKLKVEAQRQADPEAPTVAMSNVRRRLDQALRDAPTPAKRAEILEELKAYRAGLPADVYKKHFCGVDPTVPCGPGPAAPPGGVLAPPR